MAQFRYGPPRYSSQDKVFSEVSGNLAADTSAASKWGMIGSAFNSLKDFVRPAAIKEATDRGTTEALDDIREGKFKMRNPYTVRSRAYNAASHRVVGAKARSAWSANVGDVIKNAPNEEELRKGLDALTDESMGDLGSDFADVRSGLEAQSAAMFEMARGRFASPKRIISRDKAAAGEALETARQTAATVAEQDPDGESANAAIGEGLRYLGQWGPKAGFTVGDITFPPDESRAETMSVRQIAAAADDLAREATRGKARGTVRDADVVASLIRDIDADRTGLPPDLKDVMREEALREQNRRNNERQAAEASAVASISRAAGRSIPPDVPTPPTLPVPARMEENAGRRAHEIQFEIAELPMEYARNEIERRMGDLSPAGDAERIEELTAYLDRIGELSASGATADDPSQLEGLPVDGPALQEGRTQWGEEVSGLFRQVKERPPVTVEDVESLQLAAENLRAEGQRHADDANVQHLTERRALERNSSMQREREQSGAVNVARQYGNEVDELDLTTTETLAETLLARSGQMSAARDRLGIVTGSDVTEAEATAMAELLQGATAPERVRFMEQIGELPMVQRRMIGNALRDIKPGLAAAITAAGVAAVPAARAIDQPAASHTVDSSFVADVAGQDAADMAADMAFVGMPNAEQVAIDQAATVSVRDALEGRVQPEDVDADLNAETARAIASRAQLPFDTELDEADLLVQRIASSPDIARLADAARFSADSPEAVSAFTRMVEDYEATSPEEQDAFIEKVRSDRVRRNTQSAQRPLYYSGEELTMDGLKSSAERIVREFRRGSLLQEQYEAQSLLIQSLVEELNG